MKSTSIKKVLLGALAVAVLGGGVVRAEEVSTGDRAFSIGPRATFVKPKGADGKWFGGAQMRFGLGPSVALEGSIDYRKHDFPGDARLIVYPVQASLLALLVPSAPVSPYLLAGAGWYFSRVEVGSAHATDNRFGPHAGAGLEMALSPSVSLDGSYRYVWLEKFRTENENALEADYEDTGYMVTIGVNFRF